MTQEPVGYQSQPAPADDLRGRLAQSPTGRQLASDGSLVLPLFTDDPEGVLLSPPDGTIVMWNDGGTLRLRGFTRATGWQTI